MEAFMHHSPVWQHLNGVREDDLLEHLQQRIGAIAKKLDLSAEEIQKALGERRRQIAEQMKREDPQMYAMLKAHRGELDEFERGLGKSRLNGRKISGLDNLRDYLHDLRHLIDRHNQTPKDK